jgi:hypothetical protein
MKNTQVEMREVKRHGVRMVQKDVDVKHRGLVSTNRAGSRNEQGNLTLLTGFPILGSPVRG